MSEDIKRDLKNDISDYAHTGVGAVLSAIPLVGGSVSELFNLVIAPPLEKRREQWLLRIYTSLIELENKVDNFKVENLVKNELFISVIMQATQLALRNHQAEKLVALHNAVINTASNISIEETEQLLFLKIVDDLSVWHLKVLHYFGNPNQWFIDNGKQKPDLYMGSPSHALLDAFGELQGKDAFTNMIIRDLYNNGLFSSDSINVLMSESGIFASRTTDFGNGFLRYITEV
jgi:hypothetical protein